MATKKKMLLSSAGTAAAGGGALDIDDVFSTYLNSDGSSNQTIVNNIDLAEHGGLVWGKSRNLTEQPFLVDSARGKGSNNNFKYLRTTSAAQQQDIANRSLSSMNSNGFTFQGADSQFNASGNQYVYWTFRKAPKFFTICEWTGTGSTQTISHDLSSNVGFLVIKRTDTSGGWMAYHRKGFGSSWGFRRLDNSTNFIDPTSAALWSTYIGNGSNFVAPTSTEFLVNSANDVNASGGTYVAYLFAHHPNDGSETGFGSDGDSPVISCGSYTGNQNAVGPVIDLGFEPQWVMVKNSTSTGGWQIMDSMRGMVTGGGDGRLQAQDAAAETTPSFIDLTPTGFQVTSTGGNMNANNATYIYMAIRRGPLAVPTDATDVYSAGVVQNNTGRTLTNPLGHPSDWAFTRGSGEGHWIVQSRLTGKADLKFDLTNSEVTNKGYGFGNNTNYEADGTAAIGAYGWNFRRAPGFFDVVAYSGSNSAKTVGHNLTVTPEMMWVKSRSNGNRWTVFHKDMGPTKRAFLDLTQAFDTGSGIWNNTAPTSAVFTVGTDSNTNYNGHTFIAYLFASAPGVSKVGSYNGDGTTDGSKIIDCGFTSGARFVMIKTTNTGGDWMLYDTARGIIAGNDPVLRLNTNSAENGNFDNLIPNSSGFAVIQNTDGAFTTNENGHSYIFYAIA